MSSTFDPMPLSSRAVYRLIHFNAWAVNFLQDRLGFDEPKYVLPKYFKLTNPRTGEIIKLPTDLRYEEKVVAVMERLRVKSLELK